ncbi:MAG: 50S ribosomal protein L10 [Armatimonadetes bacterium]|nr:50S ribosomal protein L10 [Armatimonadota bacterium]
MPTAKKADTIETIKERYSRAVGVIFTEYRGLKVHQVQALRKQLKEKGGELQVVKNTLFKIAAGDDAEKFTDEMSSGPTAVAFLYENETDCAKVLMDFAKDNKALVVKSGLIEGKIFDKDGVEAFSKLPSRDVLIAQVIGTIAAPLSQLVGTVEALYATPIRTIGAVADKFADGSAPAAEEAAAPAAEEAPAEAPAEEAPADQPAAEEAAPTESQEETQE